MAECLERDQKFIIRLKDVSSNGILSSLDVPDTSFDLQIRRILTRRQSAEVKQDPQLYRYLPWNQHFSRLEKGSTQTDYELNIRVVRLQLPDGTWECMAMNLDEDEFSAEQLAEIYHGRWNEETGFRKLKYSAGLLYFKSLKRENIEQEIYGRMALFNLNAMLLIENKRLEEQQKKRQLRYKPCFATALTNLREFLKKRITGCELMKRIKKYLVVIRPDRKNKRRKRSK